MVTLTYQERFKTIKGVFDEFTNRTLFILQKKGCFDKLVSPIAIGKESNVFLASRNDSQVIVKIYRIQNANFSKMFSYIKKDPRYGFLKNQRRQVILSWAQREYKNLLKANQLKINIPKVIGWKNHILVEEMVGDANPALRLKDSPPKNPLAMFKEIVTGIRTLYKGGLIHGDLSPFNILNFQEKPYFIDFSQATITKTPNSEELLQRDVKIICNFFNKMNISANFKQTFLKVTK